MARRPLAVTLYGRPGCGLCDEAEVFLARIGRKIPLAVSLVNIETDDELLRRYVVEIPVVMVGGREIARAPIYEKALEDALQDAASR
ncbi:MAG: hypothetical protein C0506_05155 [Anaerolinea sp.]|nr:hypothetical protein [Anaerolinea sp.]